MLQGVRDLRPHRSELVRNTGQRDDARASVLHSYPRCNARRREWHAARRVERLSPRRVEQPRHIDAATPRHIAQAVLNHRQRHSIFLKRHAQHIGQRPRREVVMRGAETAAQDEQIRLLCERETHHADQRLKIVGDNVDAAHRDPSLAEVGADPRAVGIAYASVEEFVAAQHDDGAQERRPHLTEVPGSRISPRALRK